jgi:hypothetical protein
MYMIVIQTVLRSCFHHIPECYGTCGLDLVRMSTDIGNLEHCVPTTSSLTTGHFLESQRLMKSFKDRECCIETSQVCIVSPICRFTEDMAS